MELPDYTTLQIILIFAALFIGSYTQAAVGFASALVTIPLLIFAEIDLRVAIATTMLASTFQNIAGTYKLRHEIEFREALLPGGLRLASLPAGAALIFVLGDLMADWRYQIGQLFGVLILLILFVQRCWRVTPKPKQHPAWLWTAFLSSGFLQGSLGLPGPTMVLWLMAHDWSPGRARGFLFLMFLVCMPLHVVIFCFVWPGHFLEAIWVTLISVPGTIIGTWFGLMAGKRFSKMSLRRVTFGLLIAIAVNQITIPYWFPLLSG